MILMESEEVTKQEDYISQLVKKRCDREFEILKYQIDSANGSISEVAIDKTLKLVTPIAATLMLIIAVSGFLGYQDIKASVKELVHNSVSSWFSYDLKSSPIIEELNSLRDRYLVDSVTIRYLKAKADSRNYYFKLSDKERDALIRIAKTRNTNLVDFSDAINALKLDFSGFSELTNTLPGDYRGAQFEEIFTQGGFTEQVKKQGELLRVYSNDYSLVGIAKNILESKNEYLHKEAFNLIASTGQSYAIEYAKKNLTGNSFDQSKFRLAKYLAKEEPLSEELKTFISKNFENSKPNLNISHNVLQLYYELISNGENLFSIFSDDDKSTIEYKTNLAFNLFERLIKNGMKIRIDSHSESMVAKISEHSYVSISRSEAAKIFNNDDLLNWLISRKKDDLTWVARVINTFDLRNGEDSILGIQAKLEMGTEFSLANNRAIGNVDVEGPFWLKLGTTKNELLITYKDKIGEYHTETVVSSHKLSNSEYSFRFNKDDFYKFTPYNFY